MKFSIAMATYNGSNYVLEQLESFAKQTYQPYELVVCDDGSSDNTIEIIEEFAKEVSFKVRIYKNKKNLGYAQNFAKAIGLCEGDWVTLSDHDDVWMKEKLLKINEVVENNPSVKIIIHDYILTDAFLNAKENTNMQRLKLAGESDKDMISGCATAISKDIINLVLPIPQYVSSHDTWIHAFFKYKLALKYVLKEPLIFYRRHNLNESSSFQSTEQKQTKFRKLLYYRTDNPLSNYLLKLDTLYEMRARMIEQSQFHFDIIALDKVIELNKKRVSTLSSSFPQRQRLSIKLLLSGGYKEFNGFISFFNDFLKIRANKLNDKKKENSNFIT